MNLDEDKNLDIFKEDLPNDSIKGSQGSADTSSQGEMGNELQKKISEDLPNDSSKGLQGSADTSSQGEMGNHLPDNGKRKSKKEVLERKKERKKF